MLGFAAFGTANRNGTHHGSADPPVLPGHLAPDGAPTQWTRLRLWVA